MTTDSVIDAVTREFVDFCLEEAEDTRAESQANYCAYAQVFQRWADGMLEEYVRANPTPIRLAQAKVLLIDRFFEWRASVPKSHRNRIGENGHVCLFQVFDQVFQQIKLAQLTVTPPLLFLPPSPPQPLLQSTILGLAE